MSYIRNIAVMIKKSIPEGVSLPDNSDALFDIYALLALSKGRSTTAEDVHNAWSAWITPINPEHPSLTPFTKLSDEVKTFDMPFLVAIHTIADKINRHNMN